MTTATTLRSFAVLLVLLLPLAGCRESPPATPPDPVDDGGSSGVPASASTAPSGDASTRRPATTAPAGDGSGGTTGAGDPGALGLGQRMQPQPGLAWVVPSGWTYEAGSGMRYGTLRPSAGPRVEVSITTFPGDVGGEVANVNRWRGQLGLSPIGPGELDEVLVPVEGAASPSKLADLSNGGQRMLVAMIQDQGRLWFAKLQASASGVEAHEAAFRAFVRSFDVDAD